MNEFVLDDLNDIAETFSDKNDEHNKSLHRLYMELKITVMEGFKFLLVDGECPHLGLLRRHKLTVTLDHDDAGAVTWTRLSGWIHRSENARSIPLSQIVHPL